MIDVYQAATQMTDESNMTYAFHADSLLDKALGAEGYYVAFTANMHTDFNPSAGQTGSDAIIASAQARGVPVITARQMLEWLDGRNGSSFESITWNGTNLLEFQIAVGAGANGLHAMVPASASGSPIVAIALNGQPVTLHADDDQGRAVRGVRGAERHLPGQLRRRRDSAGDHAPSAPRRPTATAIVQWTTNEASDSRVDYGTSPAALTLSVINTPTVTAHTSCCRTCRRAPPTTTA